jgi:sugar lactone lactonase YvrE
MAVVETVARARMVGGTAVERLVCHPRLPLVAGLDSARPAVHIWDFGAREFRALATVGADSAVYGDALGSDRFDRTPAAVWHPSEPVLLVAGEGGVTRWAPAGVSELDGLPPMEYVSLAFSPDGQTLWASPSASAENNAWESSDVIDLGSGAVGLGAGPRWDTGVAVHPGGGLVATLCSDQGGTYGLFARVGDAGMRVLRRALMLDCDGYETPIFSADGRHLAIRGNAYGHSVEVFAFPSLDRVLATTLGELSSRHNLAFGAEPGVLWVGTPRGTLVEVHLDGRQAVEHDVPAGVPVTALATTATGELVVAGSGGEVLLLGVRTDVTGAADDTARAVVREFLDSTDELPVGADLWTHLVITDGSRTWEPAGLATVTAADPADPSWLRIQAAMNSARAE